MRGEATMKDAERMAKRTKKMVYISKWRCGFLGVMKFVGSFRRGIDVLKKGMGNRWTAEQIIYIHAR